MESFENGSPKKVTILSPHIDDAAYGLAVIIGNCVRNRIDLTILNCFTYTQWTIRFVSKDLNEISLLRKEEDLAFYKQYNVPINIVNLEMVDAPLRSGYIFQTEPLNAHEWLIVDQLKQYLQQVDGILLCPLAIGGHIDHVICLEAAMQLYDKMDILFFEDLPYANRILEDQIHRHINRIEERLNVKFSNDIYEITSCSINKEQVINLYKTQINSETCAEIVAHLNRLSGERLWGDPQLIQTLKNSYLCS